MIADTGAKERNALYALYKPGIGQGNLQSDVKNRGWNDAIKKVLVTLGLDSEKKVEERFLVMDRQDWDRSQERVDELNQERRRSNP